MKKSEILKELKEIRELMSQNIVGAWDRDLSGTTDAVALGDVECGDDDDPITIEYNGWSEKLEALTKALEETEQSKIDELIETAEPFLSYDDYEEMKSEVIALTKLTDKHVSLDHTLGDNVFPIEKYEHVFTVGTFLEEVGYVK